MSTIYEFTITLVALSIFGWPFDTYHLIVCLLQSHLWQRFFWTSPIILCWSRYINVQFFFFIRNFSKPRPEDQIQYTIAEKKDKRAIKAHVNALFFRQLKELLRKSIYTISAMCQCLYVYSNINSYRYDERKLWANRQSCNRLQFDGRHEMYCRHLRPKLDSIKNEWIFASNPKAQQNKK